MTISSEKANQAVMAAILAVAPDTDPATVDPSEDLWYALDLDSMDQLNVLVAIGDRLAIEIPEGDYPQLGSLTALNQYLTAAGRSSDGESHHV